MKKIVFAILTIFILSSFSFADSLYEKKLEYKRKKIDILVKTRYVGELEKQKYGDVYEYSFTTEAGYSYKTVTSAERTGITTQVKEVTDWIILKGGIRELNDVEFLYLTGNDTLASEIQEKIDSRSMWRNIGMVTSLIGLGVIVSGANSGDSGTITTGGIVSLLGVIVSALNYPVKHYIYPDFAQEEADKYNIKLKKDLGLPIDFE